ncbi:DeoR family transcriptional regulator [Noviherbaspirillum denitrificans]|uniref:HTH deoR-type domain-containing protein n=1 Tax=Noviherbaspirillum denitrificans TaxID=1968433 RepID=A0A254TDP4_9BURK|nr:DeoR family transcriptional regulator [Noviherbaspirillum denitrificans]OWW20769.1 hypothetical protein AYR66_16100 [Noviherbaspirillum denitrificans]
MARRQYLDIQALAELLRKSERTIRRDLRRHRLRVPPPMYIPGASLLRWRMVDIERWRQEQQDLSRDI